MPNAPKKITRPWLKAKPAQPFERERTPDAFDYNCRAWRNRRRQQLEQEPCCRECAKQDIVTVATVVDHIIRIAAGGDPWASSNLQSLCAQHHNAKSGRERHSEGGMG